MKTGNAIIGYTIFVYRSTNKITGYMWSISVNLYEGKLSARSSFSNHLDLRTFIDLTDPNKIDLIDRSPLLYFLDVRGSVDLSP